MIATKVGLVFLPVLFPNVSVNGYLIAERQKGEMTGFADEDSEALKDSSLVHNSKQHAGINSANSGRRSRLWMTSLGNESKNNRTHIQYTMFIAASLQKTRKVFFKFETTLNLFVYDVLNRYEAI